MEKNIRFYFAILLFGIGIVILIFAFQKNIESDKFETLQEGQNTYDIKLKNIQTENPYVKEIFAKCGIEKHCTIEGLYDLAQKEDKQVVLRTVREILSTYEKIGFYCHENGHHIGMFVYGFIGNVSEAISSIERKCGGSVYHGIIENYFLSTVLLENQNVKDLKITNICDEIDGSDLIKVECLHGIGHGLLKAYNFDGISALHRCDEVTQPESCYNGVAMENAIKYREANNESLNGFDIIHYCSSLDKKYQPTCYQYQASNILISNKYSIKESFALCDTIENQEEIDYCYFGIGTQIFFAFLGNMEKTISECQQGKSNFQSSCISGSELVILDQLGIDKGLEFCKTIPENFKSDCYYKIGTWARSSFYSEEKITNICSSAEDGKYFEDCVTKIPKGSKCTAIIILPDNTTQDYTDSIGCGLE